MARASCLLTSLGLETSVLEEKSSVGLQEVLAKPLVIGRLTLEQSSFDAVTTITGEISGLGKNQLHAISISVFGDLTQATSENSQNSFPHFNPFGKNHGSPDDEERHVGGLGNVMANEQGVAVVNIKDRLVKLIGPQSVIGRSIVVSVGADDLGKGGAEDSLVNGNCGSPAAVGVIGIAPSRT